MTTQIAVKIPDEVLARIDEMVAKGLFQSRSAAVRQGLETLLVAHKRRAVDRAFRDAFRENPETDDEMKEAHRLAIESIHDEVWEKWW
jgi:Arc/MetJ-type ribon-helix-helix transcriptional regulator